MLASEDLGGHAGGPTPKRRSSASAPKSAAKAAMPAHRENPTGPVQPSIFDLIDMDSDGDELKNPVVDVFRGISYCRFF